LIAIVSVALPEELKRAADELALQRGVSLNQFIASAVAEKVSALRTVADLQARAGRANRAAFLDVLARAGRGQPPVPGDELPAGAAGRDVTGPDLTGGERS
jgi:hypothetical protein